MIVNTRLVLETDVEIGHVGIEDLGFQENQNNTGKSRTLCLSEPMKENGVRADIPEVVRRYVCVNV